MGRVKGKKEEGEEVSRDCIWEKWRKKGRKRITKTERGRRVKEGRRKKEKRKKEGEEERK